LFFKAAKVGPVTRDMFGRPVGDKSLRKRALNADGTRDAVGSAGTAVRYKFQTGVTDAVRRTVRVQDLL